MAQVDANIPMQVRAFNLGDLADSYMSAKKFMQDQATQRQAATINQGRFDIEKAQEGRAAKDYQDSLATLADQRKQKRRQLLHGMLGDEAEVMAGLPPEQRGAYYTNHLLPSLKDDGFDVADMGPYDDKLIDGWRQLSMSPEERSKERVAEGKNASGANAPMNVKEWGFYNTLAPEDQSRYLEMKRALKTVDLGGEEDVLGPGGAVAKRYTKTLKPGELPVVKGQQAAAEAAGKESVTGDAAMKQDKFKDAKEKTAKARASQIQSMSDFADLVDKVATNPGLSGTTGVGQLGHMVPGSSWADADADVQRIVASGALETMGKLKRESPTGATGFGALSEKELAILQNGFSSLANRNISPEKKKLELQRISQITRKYLKNETAGAPAASTAPSNAPVTEFPGGIKIRKVR